MLELDDTIPLLAWTDILPVVEILPAVILPEVLTVLLPNPAKNVATFESP